MSQHIRQVIIYRDEDGYWIVECPSLKGCVSQGKTKEEALVNIKEAIAGYVVALQEDNLPISNGFTDAANYVLKKNAELYRRLA